MYVEDLINSDKIFMEFISNVPGDIRERITVRRFLPKAVVARKGEKIKYIDENLISIKKGKININKNQYNELINSLENLKYK